MSAQHLFGAISLDALGAAVPTADMALRIEHVDGVFLDTIDQRLELPVAFFHLLARGLFGSDACPDVADTAEEIHPAIFANRRNRELHRKLLARPMQSRYFDPPSEH